MSKEAFVYRWYDAPNDMYYLGKHKGSPDDKYTHSSWVWPRFTKDNIPEGVTREIIAKGTDEEMSILEHKLLKFAKENGNWDRYYNESLGDPRYVDMSGENNPMWKGGISLDPVAYEKKYRRRSPEYHAHMTKHRQTPEYKAKKRAYDKAYDQTPERKAKKRAYDEERNQTPKRKAWRKRYDAERYARKKAEKPGAGTLDAFLK